MIQRTAIPLLTATAVLLSIGCGNDRVVGNSTEAENLVTAREFTVDSILPGWIHQDSATAITTLRLDSTEVDFRHTDSLGRDLSVERSDSTPIPFEVVFWDRASAMGRIHLRLDSSCLAPHARIRLRWGFPIQRRSDPVSVWRNIPDSQKLALNSVLVDDFEHGKHESLLPNAGTWYAFTDDSKQASAPSLEADTLGRSGTVAHIFYSGTKSLLLMGLALGGRWNLRSLDSIVFWTRGTGTVSPTLENLDSATGGKAWTHLALDSTKWTRIRIRPTDFDTADNVAGNVGWNAVRYRVTNLTFIVNGGRDLYLDDIRMYGVDRDDFQ